MVTTEVFGKKKRFRGPGLAFALLGALAAGLLMVSPALAAEADIMKKLDEMQREIDALKSQVRSMGAVPVTAPVPAPTGPQVTFGGQYRINGYIADNDSPNTHDQEAARARIRQNVDIKFDEQFKTHLQVELNHTTDNITTTNNSNRAKTGDSDFAVRHAVLDYTFTNGINGQAGIVPLADYFGDTLFSSDWNYNPLALSITAPVGTAKLRLFAAKLNEGSETKIKDDFDHYQADLVFPLGGKNQINVGGSLIRTAADVFPTPPATTVQPRKTHYNYGIGAQIEVAKDWMLNGFVLGSHTNKELLAAGASDGKGTAFKLELTGPVGPGKFGIMATHARGRSDGSGFLPVMALAKTNGYWGYTGILTIQGPTDTGFDGDSVNISNNGYGLTTVQAKYAFPITKDLSGYLGVGWFGNADTPGSRDEDVGTDAIVMGTYRFNKWLALDFGYAYAKLKDGVSGYFQGALGGADFNDSLGERRDKSVFFTRLQAEF